MRISGARIAVGRGASLRADPADVASTIGGMRNGTSLEGRDHARKLHEVNPHRKHEHAREFVPLQAVASIEAGAPPPALDDACDEVERDRGVAESYDPSERQPWVELPDLDEPIAHVAPNVPLHLPAVEGVGCRRAAVEQQLPAIALDRIGVKLGGERPCCGGQGMLAQDLAPEPG